MQACIDSCLVLEVLHRCDCIPTGTLLSLYDAHRLSEIRNASQGHKIPLCFQRDAGRWKLNIMIALNRVSQHAFGRWKYT